MRATPWRTGRDGSFVVVIMTLTPVAMLVAVMSTAVVMIAVLVPFASERDGVRDNPFTMPQQSREGAQENRRAEKEARCG